jgi:vacuolar-type H+-ATPase subunit H
MKIIQSKVRVGPRKVMPIIPNSINSGASPNTNIQKPVSHKPTTVPKPLPMKKPLSHTLPSKKANDSSYNETAATLKQILESAKEELILIRKMKEEIVRYHQQTTNKARSEAHQLILSARLKTQREMDAIIRQTNEEIQKVLADIRVLRITAQDELATQRRLTDVATLNSLTLSIKDAFKKSAAKAAKK